MRYKLFKTIARDYGYIYKGRKQHGWLARVELENRQTTEFQLPKINLTKGIPVRSGGQIIDYI